MSIATLHKWGYLMSKIEDAVMRKIYERSLVGKRKYGVTMERTDYTLRDWLIEAQQEAMDLAVYLEKTISEHCDCCKCATKR